MIPISSATAELENYDIADVEKVPIIKTWLGREGLNFIETLTTEKQEMCMAAHGYSKAQWKIRTTEQWNDSIITILQITKEERRKWEMDYLRIKADKLQLSRAVH